MKKYLKLALKILVSGGALLWVFSKVDLEETRKLLLSAQWGWLVLAVLFFNFSKILSAFRLNNFFRDLGFHLTERMNLRLNYIGMFYNLFLPGGVGGDGYKVYLLNKLYKKPVKQLLKAVLLDRISGLVALVFLALSLAYFTPLEEQVPFYLPLVIGGTVLCLPLYYLAVSLFFSDFKENFVLTTAQSLGVQGLQVICAYFLLQSLGVNSLFVEYQFLFLISSVVAVFPFTIGGIGARELTFLLGYQYLAIDKNTAVAFSLLFFLITAVSSLPGMFLKGRFSEAPDAVRQSSSSRASSMSESSS